MTNHNLATNLAATAEAQPDRPALLIAGQKMTYAELETAAQRCAGVLSELGVRAGDRVALMLPNIPAFPIVYYATLRLGAIVVPLNPLFKRREIEFHLNDAETSLIVAMPAEDVAAAAAAQRTRVVEVGADGQVSGLASARPVADIAEKEADDTAVILYTSGTTGRPKGAELTAANLQTNLVTTGESLLALRSDDVVMGCLPLFHVFGMTCGMNAAFRAGAALAMIPRFDPAAVIEAIERHRVTVFEGVPTMYAALLAAATAADTAPDLSSLRTALSGGASLPVELLRRFEGTFGCQILEGYGLSETSPVVSFNQLDMERRPGSIGRPVPGVEMRLAGPGGADVPVGDTGEIWIRGENVMKAYWRRPDETAQAIDADGWFKSGDIARQDAEGYYYIVDRVKDMIIRGGLNVYPREIEEVLYEHPAVAEAAVVGMPHDDLGEEVAAYVVLKPGTEAPAEDLIAHVKDQVAPYKYPRSVHFLDELPKGATGKILKRELRARP